VGDTRRRRMKHYCLTRNTHAFSEQSPTQGKGNTIAIVLHCIYEPWFEKMNCSFGFRPNYGTHDSINAITSQYTNGMRTALEGDIEAAYDSVNRETLIKVLTRRITDKK
jgi:hypothetical protein